MRTLYLLVEDPRLNRYQTAGAYQRDANSGILAPVKNFSKRLWGPDDLSFRHEAKLLPAKIRVNGKEEDGVLDYLASGSLISGVAITYTGMVRAKNETPNDAVATVADITNWLRSQNPGYKPMKRDAQKVLDPVEGAELVRARYFTFTDKARLWLADNGL